MVNKDYRKSITKNIFLYDQLVLSYCFVPLHGKP